MNNQLLIGYGNLDRQDDGVAWHILQNVSKNFGANIAYDTYELLEDPSANLKIFFSLQLLPEMAEFLEPFDIVYFIDAHTGEYDEDILISEIHPKALNSPFTHHLTPEMLLSICQTMFNHYPKSFILSVKGHEFGFSNKLSTASNQLYEEASSKLIYLISSGIED